MTYPELQHKGSVAKEHLETLLKDGILIAESSVMPVSMPVLQEREYELPGKKGKRKKDEKDEVLKKVKPDNYFVSQDYQEVQTDKKYKVNFRQLIHLIRNKLICSLVAERHGRESSHIIGCMLDASQKINAAEVEEKSEYLTLDQIETMSGHCAEGHLQLMAKDKYEIINKTIQDKRFEFCVNLKGIKKALQQTLAETYVSHKYSEEHKRVVRILLHKGHLKES